MLKRMHFGFWVLFVLLMIYISISVYFMEHFFPGTRVNGERVEFFTTREVMDQVLADAKQYELKLVTPKGETIGLDLSALGVSFVRNDAVKHVKRLQNGFLWPRMFVQVDSYHIVPGAAWEEEVLSETIASFSWMEEGTEPQDAWVELTDGGYQLHPEKVGTRIDEAILMDTIRSYVSNMLPELDLREVSCWKTADITVESEAITSLTRQLDHWLETEVIYCFGPETEVLDASDISGFITLEGYTAQLNEAAIAEWVTGLAQNRDTYKVSRKFKSTNRGTITMKGGNTGWQIDQKEECAALLAHIEQGEKIKKEPAYLRTGNPWTENYDIGDTYIEIDITAQHMWVYIGGDLLIDTDVVTGNMRRGHDTPEMVAAVKYKARNAVLRGEGYASHVKYWMPFYGNYGIHDASWRAKFGGDIYLTNGSHGCVNTPRDAMRIIFEHVEKGTPVVLYY